MEEIKARVQERRASGFYSEEEVRRITQMELELTESAPTFSDELEQHLVLLNDGWDTQPTLITSHRAGGPHRRGEEAAADPDAAYTLLILPSGRVQHHAAPAIERLFSRWDRVPRGSAR
jgi:hypothetical protein